jgi:hypothetical protein
MEEIKGFLLKARAGGDSSEPEGDVDARMAPYRTRFLGLIVSLAAPLFTKRPIPLVSRNSSTRDSSRACAAPGPGRSTKRSCPACKNSSARWRC